jgi:hypothetical protein
MSKAPSCLADKVERDTIQLPVQRWHLHRGTVQYFICGPGSAAMHPCSAPVYQGRYPTITVREGAIARKAIDILHDRHGQNRDAGPKDIQAALNEAAACLPTNISKAANPDAMEDLSDILDLDSELEPAI